MVEFRGPLPDEAIGIGEESLSLGELSLVSSVSVDLPDINRSLGVADENLLKELAKVDPEMAIALQEAGDILERDGLDALKRFVVENRS